MTDSEKIIKKRMELYNLNAKKNIAYLTVLTDQGDAYSTAILLFNACLNELTIMVDAENCINTSAGFPLAGERIIRVRDTFKLQWNYELIPDVDVFFIKGGTKMPITLIEPQLSGIKAFVITIAHFSDEYVPCKVRIQSKKIDTIFDESFTFKVLKGN